MLLHRRHHRLHPLWRARVTVVRKLHRFDVIYCDRKELWRWQVWFMCKFIETLTTVQLLLKLSLVQCSILYHFSLYVLRTISHRLNPRLHYLLLYLTCCSGLKSLGSFFRKERPLDLMRRSLHFVREPRNLMVGWSLEFMSGSWHFMRCFWQFMMNILNWLLLLGIIWLFFHYWMRMHICFIRNLYLLSLIISWKRLFYLLIFLIPTSKPLLLHPHTLIIGSILFRSKKQLISSGSTVWVTG